MYDPVMLGGTLGVRVQNCQCCWVLHQCTTNVPPSDVGWYIGDGITKLPVLLGHTSMYHPVFLGGTLGVRLQNCQCYWVVRQCMTNVLPNGVWWYIVARIAISPMMFGLTLVYR